MRECGGYTFPKPEGHLEWLGLAMQGPRFCEVGCFKDAEKRKPVLLHYSFDNVEVPLVRVGVVSRMNVLINIID